MTANLFIVWDKKTKTVIQTGFGQGQKPKAKSLRDKLNEEHNSKGRFVVKKGSDHFNSTESKSVQ
jgi:IS1 family transposase